MKTELRDVPHTSRPGVTVFEVWHNGQFIASICGADGPGVRVFSKHTLTVEEITGVPNEVTVKVGSPTG